jgi:hypothetical protein
LWLFEERAAFSEAQPETLNPPRWIENNAMLGRRAPLPPHFTIEVKGSLISPTTDDIYINRMKLDRAWDLFQRGFT